MIDEPGSFYICTETSPRCYIIQKVSARNVHKVCSQIASASADINANSYGHHSHGDEWDGGGPGPPLVPEIVPPPPGRSACATPPPLPVLPWWFTPECERQLENGELSLGVEKEGCFEEEIIEEEDVIVSPRGSQDCVVGEPPPPPPQVTVPLEVQVPDVGCRPDDFEPRDGAQNGHSSAGWTSPVSNMGTDELKSRLRNQLEYYFSRENLAGDTYLRSQMDNDQYVPIRIIAGFPMVKRLTLDKNLIVEVLRESAIVQVDESGEKVRPAYKRCTLLLREIPESTDVKEVKELFSRKNCPPFVSVEYAHNNSWYVNFETEEEAQRAFLYLRTEVGTFKGKPILARIKTGPAPRVAPPGGDNAANTAGATTPTSGGNGGNSGGPQNGYRPVPPNSLPAELLSPGNYPAVSVTSMTQTSQPPSLVSPCDSLQHTPPDPVTGSPGPPHQQAGTYFYPSGSNSRAFPVAGPVVSPSPGWTGAVNFDLGLILAINGFQPQGTFRPLIQVPPAAMQQLASASPALHQNNNSHSQLPRRYSNCRQSKHNNLAAPQDRSDHSSTSSIESGRPHPPEHSRMTDHPGGDRGARGGGGGFHPRRGQHTSGGFPRGTDSYRPPYREREGQNYHYDKVLRRPPRHNDHQGRPIPRRRSPHGANTDHWSSKSSATKDNHHLTSVSPGTDRGKSVDNGIGNRASFELQPSSFPPLPTTHQSREGTTKQAPPLDTKPDAKSPVQTTTVPKSTKPENQCRSTQTVSEGSVDGATRAEKSTTPKQEPKLQEKNCPPSFSSVAANKHSSSQKNNSVAGRLSSTVKEKDKEKESSPPTKQEITEENKVPKKLSYAEMAKHLAKDNHSRPAHSPSSSESQQDSGRSAASPPHSLTKDKKDSLNQNFGKAHPPSSKLDNDSYRN